MLPAKPWKSEAIVRLLISVFLCMYAGSVATLAIHGFRVGRTVSPWFYVCVGAAFVFIGGALVLLHREWRVEQVARRLAMLLICFYAGIFLGVWAQKLAGAPGPSVPQMAIGALSFQGATLVLVNRLLRGRDSTWQEAFGLSREWKRALVYGVLCACLFLPIALGLQAGSAIFLEWFSGLYPRLHLNPEEQQAVQTVQMARTWFQRGLLGAITILLAPAAEEVLFRGVLYSWVKQAGYPRLALWSTAVTFAAIHFNLVSFLPLLLLALALTFLYERTGNLLAPVITHAVFNAFNFVLLLMRDQIEKLQ